MNTFICRWFHRLLKIGKSCEDYRTVFVGNKLPSNFVNATSIDLQKFPSNRITSSRYTVWNFMPKNLFEQFHRVANLYFLIMAIIELTIDSPVAPVTSIIPLSIVVGTTAIKQGYEDWLRHRADREANDCEALVVRDGQIVKVKSEDVHVGDVIKVNINDGTPCDMVLLSSASDDGRCYITSANLDGETNLKIFNSVHQTKNMKTESELAVLRASIDCQQPVTDLYQFVGRINIFLDDDDAVTVPLGPENVLLRGVRLKNTDFVYGCAIYTGQETKISLNSRSTCRKSSQVERKMNRFLLVMLCVLVIYAMVWVALTMSFYFRPFYENSSIWYLNFPLIRFRKAARKEQANIVVQLLLGFMVLCKAVIPISMYVSIELQKFIGSKFFDWDLKMYNAITDEPAKARTSDLNEELGQIEYLFTDKTGTLTQNEMRFRMCSCGGSIYEELNGDLVDASGSSVACSGEVMALLISIAVCHTVQVYSASSLDGTSKTVTPLLEYYCASPDEKALIEACSRLGVTFVGCHGEQLELVLRNGEQMSFMRRQVLDFDSTRKRMSVIIEDEANGDIWLICKGAEVAIFERTVEGDIYSLERHINTFAELGLRTLVIARRLLTRSEYDDFNGQLMKARNLLADRELEVAKVYNTIENGLCLVGATAVEDQLQDGVADTLQSLRLAGIQIWVLTGDRLETAVNVSYSSGHFVQGSTVLSVVQLTSSGNCGDALKQIDMRLSDLLADNKDDHQHNLVIDGASLSFALADHRSLLRSVCMQCAAVLCCRLSPIQKAQVVKLMKEASNTPITAAIGDGANDVSMIREAHVGFAVYGKEGRNAVRASDYAFSQFSFLKRALLVHGCNFYIRLSVLVQYFFYKNIAVVLSQLLYNFFNGFSAQSLYDNFYLTMYNTVFSSLPILVFGLLEQRISARHLMNNPDCYRTLKRNRLLSNSNFLIWTSLGIWHALVMYFGVYLSTYLGNSLFANGKGIGVYDFGALIMTTCVLTINIKLMLVTYNFNILLVGSFVLTFGAYFVISLVYNVILWKMWAPNLYQTLSSLLKAPSVWLLMVLLVVMSLIPDIILRTLFDTFSPVFQHRRKVGKTKPRVTPVSTVSFTRHSEAITVSQINLVTENSDADICAAA